MKIEYANYGTILCNHIAIKRADILRAERSEPIDEADSGWQFSCGVEVDDPVDACIWSMREVLEVEPSLLEYIDLPPGTLVERKTINAPWMLIR
jgi:hypothetical protein